MLVCTRVGFVLFHLSSCLTRPYLIVMEFAKSFEALEKLCMFTHHYIIFKVGTWQKKL